MDCLKFCTVLGLSFLVLGQGLSFADETVYVEIDEQTCRKVQRHLSNADVAYKPGVDARGNAVVPADVSGSQVKLPDTIVIDLALPLQDVLSTNNPPNRSVQNAEVNVGRLTYEVASGKLSFNGQQLNQTSLVKIGEKCYEIYGK